MALPVYLQPFKAAGIYRVVFDKSTIEGVDSEILRLVVGYSEKGPFNTPVYVKDPQQFKTLYGEISTKLEKRGIFFHRLALQCLSKGPILALNLKKFANESVNASTISTAFNNKLITEPITTINLKVEDVFDKSRFWIKDAEQLIDAQGIDSTQSLNEYIDIAITDTEKTSGSYFIRKANGNVVSGYNITVSDWYADSGEEVPEFLENKKNSLISDFFAEIFVFRGEFKKEQVLASSTLKRYFKLEEVGNEESEEGKKKVLCLKPYVENAYGDKLDTLNVLYEDASSNAIGHYVGCLIPEFKDKQGNYVSLNIIFNNDIDQHNMMMAFNTDLLDDGYNIDISGKSALRCEDQKGDFASIDRVYSGVAKTTLMGNIDSPVRVSKLLFTNNLPNGYESGLTCKENKISGYCWVSEVAEEFDENAPAIKIQGYKEGHEISIYCKKEEFETLKNKFKIITNSTNTFDGAYYWPKASGKPWVDGSNEKSLIGCSLLIKEISNIEAIDADDLTSYRYNPATTKIASYSMTINVESISLNGDEEQVYDDSIIFIPIEETEASLEIGANDKSLTFIVKPGDSFAGKNAGEIVYVQEVLDYCKEPNGTINNQGSTIVFTGDALIYSKNDEDGNYLVKLANSINQEIGIMAPVYLKGYIYENSKPKSTSMKDKLDWQHFILSTLEEYTGLRTGLLNKSDIDYRYIIDTFESYVEGECKVKLAYLAKQKENAFAILNFPSIKNFVKCPYTSFVDGKGRFNIQYVVDGRNKKKASTISFSLPIDVNGASFCAFYTPLKFGDGYLDTVVPSAALVSNLFMEKYLSRHPYYIIAGPNYGNITASGLIGPDYNYSESELQIIEPFGVNCMIYRPGFGTFINANQTAKQTPVSALSKVNVRELVIYLQDEIEKVLQAYQWEFNNPNTRNAIKDKADQICSRVQANGGIQTFLNICDESNNTPDVIDNEMCILSTHIEAGMGAGKMIQELTLYRTGQMASIISE